MTPMALGKAVFLSALGATMVLALPAAAQAATSGPAAHNASAVVPNGEIEWFTGYTYPDTAAGLAACTAEGVSYEADGVGSWTCWLGNPDAGLYGLWVLTHVGPDATASGRLCERKGQVAAGPDGTPARQRPGSGRPG
jgi:hypothetical protein